MGMYTAPGTRTGPNTVQRYPAGDPRRYANQGGVPPGSMPGKPAMPAPMPAPRPAPMPAPRPGGPQLIGGPVGRPIIGPPPAPMPSMPYGGPIGNPGLPPGVGIQGGPFIPPGGLPTNGQGTGKSGPHAQGGYPNRKDGRDPYLYGPDNGNIPIPVGHYNEPEFQPPMNDPFIGPMNDQMGGFSPVTGMNAQQMQQYFAQQDADYAKRQADPTQRFGYTAPAPTQSGNPGNPYGDGSSPRPLPPGVSMGFGMPAPNFASALGTASPLLNTIRR